MCLHVVQSQWAVGGLSELFGDWLQAKWWRRIVMLMYLPPSRWEEALPMPWLTGPRPALLCLTRSGLAQGLLTHSMRRPWRWQEDLPLILADIGQLDRQSSSLLQCNWESMKLQFLWEKYCQLAVWNLEIQSKFLIHLLRQTGVHQNSGQGLFSTHRSAFIN